VIFDRKTKRYYRIKRGWFNRLVLERVVFENVVRCLGEGDLVFDENEEGGLKVVKYPPEPKTPQPKVSKK